MADIKELLLKGLERVHQAIVATRYKFDNDFKEAVDHEEGNSKDWSIVMFNTKDFYRIVAVQGDISEVIPDSSPLINGFVVHSGLTESLVQEYLTSYGVNKDE